MADPVTKADAVRDLLLIFAAIAFIGFVVRLGVSLYADTVVRWLRGR
jgi:hypothetical protein